MQAPNKQSFSQNTVPVVLKAVRVLEAIARDPANATNKSLALTLGISPTTCYRILQSFVHEGWLHQATRGTYELSYGLITLLRPLLHHDVLIEAVSGPLSELANSTGLTSKLTIRQGENAVTIFSAASPKGTAITSRVGMTASLAIGSSGAALMKTLDDNEVNQILENAPDEAWKLQTRDEVIKRVRDARELGYCFDHGSYQPHIHTLSAPLTLPERGIDAAITILGFPQDLEPPARDTLVRQLLFTAGGCMQLINGRRVAV